MLKIETKEIVSKLQNDKKIPLLARLYGNSYEGQRERYQKAISKFEELFGEGLDVKIYSAPGRTEIERCNALEIARIGWFAETTYFSKKCGLLDQTVSAYGGLVGIDFSDVANPIIDTIDYDFSKSGYTLCITDTKSSHEDLTDDYVAIREEQEILQDLLHREKRQKKS